MLLVSWSQKGNIVCISKYASEHCTNKATNTVKLVFFACPLFHEFHNVSNLAKIKCYIYLKSCAILVYYLVQLANTRKLRSPK